MWRASDLSKPELLVTVPDLPASNERHAQSARELERFLAAYLDGLESPIVAEVRALRIGGFGGRRSDEFGFFRLDEAGVLSLWEAVKRLISLPEKDQPEGIYITMNPVADDLLARAANRLKPTAAKSSATDADITGRRWLLIDVDPVRPSGVSANDAEKASAWEVLDAVLEDLASRGWPSPLIVDSGNGFHAWYRIDLPANDGDQVRHCLQALAAKHDTPEAKVDTTVFNSSRIVKLPGTWARKGDQVGERAHRMARVLTVPDAISTVSADLVAALAAERPAPSPKASSAPSASANGHHATNGHHKANGHARHTRRAGRLSVADRCRMYVEKLPGAVAGERGHDKTFHAARVIWNDFALDESEGYPILEAFNARCSPPWDERDLRRKWDEAVKAGEDNRGSKVGDSATRSSSPPLPRPPGSAVGDLDPFELTDLGNGRRLAAVCGEDIRFVADRGTWFVWDGSRWEEDAGRVAVEAKAKSMCREWAVQAAAAVGDAAKEVATAGDDKDAAKLANESLAAAKAELAFAMRTQDKRALGRMIEMARSETVILVDTYGKLFDREPWLFNAANGTIDLRTGELRPHNRDDYLTRISPVEYDQAAVCPRYLTFLAAIFAGDSDLVAYIRGLSGVCITGDVSEHMLNVFYGGGSNGKGTLIEAAWLPVLGDYGAKIAETVLVNDGRDRHPTERADLAGVRLAVASETGQTGKLDESRVKELTGGDTVTARKMRQDFFSFAPTHKLILLTNHKPRVVGTDHGIWRRMRLVPFAVRFWRQADIDADPSGVFDATLKADPTLADALRAEAPGILADMVRNAVDFHNTRELRPPAVITNATREYRQSEDTLGQYFEERVVADPNGRLPAGELFANYKAWAESLGLKPAGSRTFGEYAKKVLEFWKISQVLYKARLARNEQTF